MEEHCGLDEGDRALVEPGSHRGGLENAGETACLHGRLLQRRILGAVPQLPAVGVAADVALVVLQLDEVEGPLAEDEEVDLRPCAVAVDELEVAPSVERSAIRQKLADVL